MKINRKTIADFFQLGSLHDGRKIFMRREFDNLGNRLKKLARIYRKHFLKRTRIVAVVGSLGKTTTRQAVAVALNCPDRNFSFSNYGSSLAGNFLRKLFCQPVHKIVIESAAIDDYCH